MISAVLLVLVMSLPVLPAPFTSWPGAAGLFMMGVLPASLAVIVHPRLGWAAAGALAVLAAPAVLLGEVPWAGALLMAVASFAAAWTARRGWHLALVLVPSMLSFLMVDPPVLGDAAGVPQPRDAAYVLAATAVLAGGAAWTALVLPIALRRLPRKPASEASPVAVRWYAGVLAALVGGTTFAVLTWLPGTTGAWLVMTLLVLARPALGETLNRTLQRTIGTVLGGALAALLVQLVPSQTALFYVGLALMTVVIVLSMGPRYWLTVTVLTPAVVFFASPDTDLIARDLQRVGFTVLAAAMVTGASLVVAGLTRTARRAAASS